MDTFWLLLEKLGYFWKKLGYFLILHLVTLALGDRQIKPFCSSSSTYVI